MFVGRPPGPAERGWLRAVVKAEHQLWAPKQVVVGRRRAVS